MLVAVPRFGARLVDAHDVVDAADRQQARAFGDQVGIEIERRLLVEDDGRQRRARLRGHGLGDHDAFDRLHDRQDGVLRRGRTSRCCTAAARSARSGRRAARRVQGTMRVGSTVSSRRHCDQLTRMRPVPSHSGKPELKRPPGEGPGTVRTSFSVAGVCAGPAMPALASSGWVFSTKLLASMMVRLPPKSTSVRWRVSTMRRPSLISRARMNSIGGVDAGRTVGARQVRQRAVVQLRVGAVGVRGVQVQPVAARRAIPAREQHAAVLQHLADTGRCSG